MKYSNNAYIVRYSSLFHIILDAKVLTDRNRICFWQQTYQTIRSVNINCIICQFGIIPDFECTRPKKCNQRQRFPLQILVSGFRHASTNWIHLRNITYYRNGSKYKIIVDLKSTLGIISLEMCMCLCINVLNILFKIVHFQLSTHVDTS